MNLWRKKLYKGDQSVCLRSQKSGLSQTSEGNSIERFLLIFSSVLEDFFWHNLSSTHTVKGTWLTWNVQRLQLFESVLTGKETTSQTILHEIFIVHWYSKSQFSLTVLRSRFQAWKVEGCVSDHRPWKRHSWETTVKSLKRPRITRDWLTSSTVKFCFTGHFENWKSLQGREVYSCS